MATTTTDFTTIYAGADWIRRARKIEPSPLGCKVADLLGELVCGIYHWEDTIRTVDWTHPRVIKINANVRELATFDSSTLTKLVFLAHEYCLRVAVSPCSPKHLAIRFWQRDRSNDTMERHPTIDEAVEAFKKGRR